MKIGRIQSLRWHTITIAEGTFDVEVYRPTAAERYRETAFALAARKDNLQEKVDCEEMQSRYRMLTAIRNWRGLTDPDGTDIPFSVPALDALCSAYPVVFHELSVISTRAFRLTFDEEQAEDAETNEGDAPGN